VPAGQSSVNVDADDAPEDDVGVPVAGPEAMLITWAGAALGLEALERPINTPTPIASSSTPTPAITVTALPRPAPSASAGPLGTDGGALAGVGGEAAPEGGPPAGPPASTLLIGVLRSPHSRQ
jgi:hypothetical protein